MPQAVEGHERAEYVGYNVKVGGLSDSSIAAQSNTLEDSIATRKARLRCPELRDGDCAANKGLGG